MVVYDDHFKETTDRTNFWSKFINLFIAYKHSLIYLTGCFDVVPDFDQSDVSVYAQKSIYNHGQGKSMPETSSKTNWNYGYVKVASLRQSNTNITALKPTELHTCTVILQKLKMTYWLVPWF